MIMNQRKRGAIMPSTTSGYYGHITWIKTPSISMKFGRKARKSKKQKERQNKNKERKKNSDLSSDLRHEVKDVSRKLEGVPADFYAGEDIVNDGTILRCTWRIVCDPARTGPSSLRSHSGRDGDDDGDGDAEEAC